jgi:anti-sigma regulatory factor (Ser/Thr protein kinase)
MGAVCLLGFTPEESKELDSLAAARGLGTENLGSRTDTLLSSSEPRIVLVALHAPEDLQVLKSLVTDAPQHAYGSAVPAAERALAFGAALTGSPLLFLPAVKDEVRRVLSQLKERAGSAAAQAAVFAGLQGFSEQFRWRTADVKVSPTCRHIARVLRQAGFFVTDAQEVEATLALEESLVNSIEHGNLELDSSLRSNESLSDDRYDEERAARLARPEYGGRMLGISVATDEECAVVSITDEGPGFDVSRMEAQSEQRNVLDASGKGLALIRRSFTEVRYNERGNVISLVKRR